MKQKEKIRSVKFTLATKSSSFFLDREMNKTNAMPGHIIKVDNAKFHTTE